MLGGAGAGSYAPEPRPASIFFEVRRGVAPLSLYARGIEAGWSRPQQAGLVHEGPVPLLAECAQPDIYQHIYQDIDPDIAVDIKMVTFASKL